MKPDSLFTKETKLKELTEFPTEFQNVSFRFYILGIPMLVWF